MSGLARMQGSERNTLSLVALEETALQAAAAAVSHLAAAETCQERSLGLLAMAAMQLQTLALAVEVGGVLRHRGTRKAPGIKRRLP